MTNTYPNYGEAQTEGQSPVHAEATRKVSSLRSAFENFASSFVDLSVQAEELKQLRSDFEGLKSEIETYRSRIESLDRELQYVREARDKANMELVSTRNDLYVAQGSIEQYKVDLASQSEQIGKLQTDLQNARNDRDNAEMHVLELQDKLSTVEAKLAKVMAVFGEIADPLPIISKDAPEPKSEPTPTTRRIYPGDEGYAWNQAQLWDNDRQQYYMEVAA